MPQNKNSEVIERKWIDSCTIVFSCNDDYSRHLIPVIRSVLNNSGPNNKFEFIILEKDITNSNKEKIVSKFNSEKVSVRFYDMTTLMDEIKLPMHGQMTIETYYRYFIPKIMFHYDKVIYLDVDVIVDSDIRELYETDMSGYCVAATRDVAMISQYHILKHRKDYMDNILKLKDPDDYFQAGVLVFNIVEIRNVIRPETLVSMTQERHWEYLDQDVMNMAFTGRTLILNQEWNVPIMLDKNLINNSHSEIVKEYLVAKEKPKIIHYAGPYKPWVNPDVDMAEYYLKYAEPKKNNGKKTSPLMDTMRKNGLKAAFYSMWFWLKNKISRKNG